MKREIILIVDDMEVNRALLSALFFDEYEIMEAENGSEAYDIIKQYAEKTVTILLDIVMPVLDGFQLLQKLRIDERLNKIPVILITGDTSEEAEKKGYDLGACEVIPKPFNSTVVKKRVSNTIELFRHKRQLEYLAMKQTEKIKLQARQLKETSNQIIDTLSTLVEFRNIESGQHIQRIKGFTRLLLNKLLEIYPEYKIAPATVDVIVSASSMHDVGKIAIPDSVLLKPGRLTPEEFDIIKTHTIRGCEIIESLSSIQDEEYYEYCYDICRCHHERYDGRGYPDGLAGENIPIAAQVVSLADAYDALVSKRVYKDAYSTDEAYHMIMNGECGQFSPRLLRCLEIIRDDFEKLANSNHEEIANEGE